ncbi:MAG: hypothetical protein PHT25_04900 [Bacteroidales bacterium]|nr:hypothetical protein [Bacteroidales bacterium]
MRIKYLLLGIMALGLLSCEKFDEGDFDTDVPPFMVNLSVFDAKGVDILNPENSNSIPLSGVKALYKGVEYECNAELATIGTKICSVSFYGLRTMQNPRNGVYYLQFGELNGIDNYSNEEVTIFWGDGTSDKIKFNRELKWNSRKGYHYIQQEWFLNGTKIPNNYISLIKN